MSDETCPHCGHGWERHPDRCCGCMWTKPEPPKPPPPPPTARETMVARAREAMFDELDRQHEAGEIDAAGYWDREWGRCDGEPDWGLVAAAAVDAVLQVTTPDEVWEWKNQ